jgi:hypothetical protein
MSKSNMDKAREYSDELEKYLNECREGVRKAPMLGGMLNKSQIAKECGFLRGVLVENKVCKSPIEEAVKEFANREKEAFNHEVKVGFFNV